MKISHSYLTADVRISFFKDQGQVLNIIRLKEPVDLCFAREQGADKTTGKSLKTNPHKNPH